MRGHADRPLIAAVLLLVIAHVAGAAPYDAWLNKAKITFTGYDKSETLTNFPALVRIGTNTVAGFDYATMTSPADGADLRFASSDGQQALNYEVESWDTGGVSLVWVQVDRIAGSNDHIWALWNHGGAAAPSSTTNGATWSNSYIGVWHLAETNAIHIDATGNGHDATAVGANQSAVGAIDGGNSFDGDSDHLEIPHDAALTPSHITVSAWVRPASVASWDMIVTKGYDGVCPYDLAIDDGARFGFGAYSGGWRKAQGTTTPVQGRLYHVTGTFDGSTFRVYEDGIQTGTHSWPGPLPSNTLPLGIGDGAWSGWNTYEFSGMIDEVRISDVARSSNWIWACWASQSMDSRFITYGPAETIATSLTVVASGVTDLKKDGATLGGVIQHAGAAENPQVYVCWDTSDKGAAATGDWATAISLGSSWAKGDAFTTTIGGLDSGSNYAYRCYVTNSTGEDWSDSTQTFTTVYLPTVTNLGATDVHGSTAVLRGEVTDSGMERPLARFSYWADGSAATSLVSVGWQDGVFQATVGVSPAKTYHYRALASNDAGSAWSDTKSFTTWTPYYVWTNGSHTAPFDTWARAATNIQSAADAATQTYAVVLVTNGTYAGETTNAGMGAVTITNSIVLMSVNGPEATIIRPVRDMRRGLLIQSTATNAFVSGFAIRDALWWNLYTGGAAIHMSAGTVSNCIIDNARSRGGVAGVYMDGGRLVDCELTRNHSEEWQYGRGGAINIASASAVVENCVITNNYTLCRYGGAGIYMTANGTVRNCLLTKNEGRREALGSESYGGAVAMSAGVLEHCTLADNYAGGPGGGVSMSGGTLRNCIIYRNSVQGTISSTYRNVYQAGGTIETSCAAPLPPGTGNVDGSPEFVDRANNDYQLGAGSAAVDAGTDIGIDTDIAGNTRPKDGDGAGGPGYDMGCYEAPDASGQPFSISFVADRTRGLDSLEVTFTVSAVGADTDIQQFWWDLNKDGTPANTTNGPGLWVVTNTYGVGYYSVTLTASNASGQVASLERDTYIQVSPSTLYVATNGSHVTPFGTPADAATNINAAVDAAYVPEGSNVLVSVGPGFYPLREEIIILKELTVRATDGPAATVVDPAVGQLRSFNLRNAGAVVEGFTIQGASMGHGAGLNGGGVWMSGGTVSNCWFFNNIIADQGGGVFMSGGLVVDCVFSNNQANEWQYGYGGAIRMTGGTAERCDIHHNSMLSKQGGAGVHMSGGTLRNCLVWSNQCTRSNAGSEGIGGGLCVSGGAVENCTVSGNYSYGSGGGVSLSGGTVSNSIVYFNTVSPGFPTASRNIYQTAGTVAFSCSDPLIGGGENTNLDPDFLGAPTNYHLSAVSPCRDSGSNQAWMVTSADLAGTNRILVGVVDMGCYEAPAVVGGALICNFSTPQKQGFTNLQVELTASVSGSDTNVTRFWWDFDDDGSADLQGADLWVVTNVYTSGYYDVSLTVSNTSAELATVRKVSYILVAPPVAYVSTNGTPMPPYMSWATAAASVQDAVNVGGYSSSAQTLVRVADGVYGSGVQTSIGKPITIRSENGPDNAIVQATGSERVMHLSDPRIWVEGLTIRDCNQSTAFYDGGGIYMTAGTVTNCVLHNNRVGGRGGGIYLAGGAVADCTFTSNRCTEWQYGYGGGLYIQGNSVCRRSVFRHNWTESHRGGGAMYVNGGLVRNCLLVDNSSVRTQVGYEGDAGGAVVGNGVMENCTIANNWAVKNGGGLQMVGNNGQVTNCIIAFNTVSTVGNDDIHNPDRIHYSCSDDLTHGIDGNITADPLFLETNEVNYKIEVGSPCKDAGYRRPWMQTGTDLGHGPRITALTVDIGAYEALPAGSVLIFQ